MKKFLLVSFVFVLVGCPVKHVETVVSAKGSVININDARFVIDEGTIAESTKIRIETFKAKGIYKKNYDHGFNFAGMSINIKPESLFFEKPVLYTYPVKDVHLKLAAKIGKGFVPLAESKVEGETLQAKIRHGGEYYIIKTPEKYGILNHSKADSALLIVSDIYVSDHIKNFRKVLKEKGYTYPVWTFIYPNENSVEENAEFLAEELKKLHEQYGKFRLDVVSFGIGGLVMHRYIVDSILYQKDISSAVIAVGTPFFGSAFASMDSLRKGRSPYRFFFIDALGAQSKFLEPGSELTKWVRENKSIPGWQHEDLEENKNFASIRGQKNFSGDFSEEYDGDGLISLASAMLTSIEPKPLSLDHYELYESDRAQDFICRFLKLYRSFNWPVVFTKAWKGEEKFSRISEIWEQEAKLNYPGINFAVLVEWVENLLQSAPKNAILITNGDNDTYPGWFLQEAGIRKDVTIVNWPLLNIPDNIRYLKNNGLPIALDDADIDSLKPHFDKRTQKIDFVADQIVNLLLRQDLRPVVFSTTFQNPHRFNYPLKLAGMVYEIGETNVKVENISVDIERTKALLNSFKLKNFSSVPYDSLYQDIQGILNNYAASAYTLSLALLKQERYDEALDLLKFVKKIAAKSNLYLGSYHEALVYSKKTQPDKADSIFRELLTIPNIDIHLKKDIAQQYFEMGRKDKAIKILAECLKENPEDTEITGLIKEYQESK